MVIKETDRVISALVKRGNTERAAHSMRFFKTAPGEYGEGDRFLGIRVPDVRRTVMTFRGIELSRLEKLLSSPWHEVRLFSLLSMVDRFKRGSDLEQHSIYTVYMKNSRRVNNWDLVDSSAPHIAGAYLFGKSTEPLYNFAVSDSMWERRISIVATQHFIRNGHFTPTFYIADLLLKDREDLIHKAVGWMLREVGNRDLEAETEFLKHRYTKMPRTMLRYAIEKFEESRRQSFLKGLI
jgi:hypothetical protein